MDLNAYANNSLNLAKLHQLDAQQRAGNMLAGGDFGGAQNALYKAGDIAGGQQVQQYNTVQRQQHAASAQRIAMGIRAAINAGHTPAEAYDMATQVAPQLGVDPNDLAKMRPAFDKDPRGFLDFVDQQAKRELEIVNRGNGGYDVVDKANGGVVRSEAGRAEPKMYGDYLYMPGGQQAPAAGAPISGQQGTPATPSADAVWSAMKQRESGGDGNAVSPKGALGSTQMLPATAQAMAQKLGVAWRPDLIRGNSPEALAYQDKLGRAYFDEGAQKYGGDLSKAASYYHGGPNEGIWGPKTRAYAQAVTQGPPMQGGAGQDTLSGAPQIPGYSLVGRVKGSDQNKPKEPPSGYQWGANGTLTPIKGGPADPSVKANDTKPTVEDKKTLGYAYRVLAANDRLNALIQEGITKPSAMKLVSDKNGVTRLVLSNQNDRRFVSAAKEWMAPILRKDTGAAVTDSEFMYYADMFIPQPEDGPELLKQKAHARQDAMTALVRETGPMYDRTFGARGFNSRWGPGNGEAHKPQGQAGPRPGTVENDYRFKGGNPADPKSWAKL